MSSLFSTETGTRVAMNLQQSSLAEITTFTLLPVDLTLLQMEIKWHWHIVCQHLQIMRECRKCQQTICSAFAKVKLQDSHPRLSTQIILHQVSHVLLFCNQVKDATTKLFSWEKTLIFQILKKSSLTLLLRMTSRIQPKSVKLIRWISGLEWCNKNTLRSPMTSLRDKKAWKMRL
jgi:hypothetical protein